VLENLADGHGLRWNVDERVQVYTHPLWMLINACAHLLSGEIFWTVTVLGLLCSLGAFLALARPFAAQPAVVGFAVLLPWLLSASLRRYTTSGFENPLTHLLLALFVARLLAWRRSEAPPWGALFLFAGLAATNRLDTVVLFVPALAWLCIAERARLRIAPILRGFAPLLAWLAFSVGYYGFFLPNTALAKVSAGVPLSAYLWHGTLYALDLVQRDPVTVLLLAAGAGVTVHAGLRWRRGSSDLLDAKLAVLGLGALCYEVYVWRVGGGFLTGRFFTAPAVVAIAGVAARAESIARWCGALSPAGRSGLGVALLALAPALLLLANGTSQLTAESRLIPLPVARAEPGRDLRWQLSNDAEIFHTRGVVAREAARSGDRVSVQTAVGFTGLAAGPEAILIDPFALTDPLLARLPPVAGDEFLAGHVRRAIPKGYAFARRTGSLERMEPALREYYGALRLLTSGDLFTRERWAAIVDFQLGRRSPPGDGSADR